MRSYLFFLFFVVLAPFPALHAQEQLPGISVKNYQGKILLSWTHNYTKAPHEINVQRSYDSLKNFYSIGVVTDPQSGINGYVDESAQYQNMFYRVFVAFEGGSYFFSRSARPGQAKIFSGELNVIDSMLLAHTKMPASSASERIYTGKENNIIINLPDAETKKYMIRFLDEGSKPIFKINRLHDSYLVVDKTNFRHAGWFYFEIYENGRLMDKNKFYIAGENRDQQSSANEKGRKNR